MLMLQMHEPILAFHVTPAGAAQLHAALCRLADAAPVSAVIAAIPAEAGSTVLRATSLPEGGYPARQLRRAGVRLARPGLRFAEPYSDISLATWTLECDYWSMYADQVKPLLRNGRDGNHCYLACTYADDATVCVELLVRPAENLPTIEISLEGLDG